MGIFPFRMKRYPDLATFLERTGVRQEDFADVVDTTQATISRVASGEMMPRPELAERIANKAHIPLDSFIKRHLAWKRQQQDEVSL